MTTPQSTISGSRRVRFVGAALAAVAVVLLSACAPPTGPTTPGQTYKEGRCAADEGVTVVVDFAPLQDRVVVRCALGAQPSGTGALAAVNLPVDPGPITGGVCKIDGLPTQGATPPAIRRYVDAGGRMRLFDEAVKALPPRTPIDVVLLPMRGDNPAAHAFWRLARNTGGSYLMPSKDWP